MCRSSQLHESLSYLLQRDFPILKEIYLIHTFIGLESMAEKNSSIFLITFLFLHCRVLVLGSGRIIEFDTPHNLLLQQGVFSKMVSEAGITQDTNNSWTYFCEDKNAGYSELRMQEMLQGCVVNCILDIIKWSQV